MDRFVQTPTFFCLHCYFKTIQSGQRFWIEISDTILTWQCPERSVRLHNAEESAKFDARKLALCQLGWFSRLWP